MGCFVDSGKRDMSFLNFQLTNTTIDYCRMSCYTLNYSYPILNCEKMQRVKGERGSGRGEKVIGGVK